MEQILIDDERYKNGDIHIIKKSGYQMSDTGVFRKVKETVVDEMYQEN